MTDALWTELRARHPHLREAIVADARLTAQYRGERHEFRSGPTSRCSACGSRGSATPSSRRPAIG